jgi:two-component system sensor histidine kinase VicK
MKRWMKLVNSVQWKLAVIYILLIIIAVQLIGVYFFRQLENYYTTALDEDLKAQAALLKEKAVDPLRANVNYEDKAKELKNLLNQLVYLNTKEQTSSAVVVRILDKNNLLLASTSPKENEIKRFFVPPDIPKAGYFQKLKDPGNGKDYRVYILPLNYRGTPVGAIYIEVPLDKTYNTVMRISKILIRITAIALLITSLLVVVLARTITSPVKEITAQATAMAAGDFDRQVDVRSQDEIGQLAIAFNHLASHLRQALKQKEEEKEKLESVLANMSDGVIATDRDGTIIVKNRWAEELLDRPIELGNSLHHVLPLSEPLKLPLTEERQTFLELNGDDPEALTILKITFTPIKPQGDEVVGLVAVLEDVTEQEKLDRQRKDFVANVSHELRTPLTTIKSYLEALDDGAIHEPELAMHFLKVTRQEAERMTRLISDLLQLSRLDAKKVTFRKKPLAVEELLEEAVDRFSVQCRQKNILLTLYFHGRLPRVYADRDKLDQVLDNLLSNAVKYTPEGGSIAVVAQKRKDGMVEIGVADTGIGIPKKDLGRIFERFYRVDKARSRSLGGTGLGLSIAQEIIRAHGGEIEIDSVYQKGTLVSFTLPPVSQEVNG